MLKCTATISKLTTLIDCMPKSYISNNFNGTICEYKGVLPCKVHGYEEFPDEIMEASLSEPFFTRIKMLSRPDGFMFYGQLELTFPPLLNFYVSVKKLGYD